MTAEMLTLCQTAQINPHGYYASLTFAQATDVIIAPQVPFNLACCLAARIRYAAPEQGPKDVGFYLTIGGYAQCILLCRAAQFVFPNGWPSPTHSFLIAMPIAPTPLNAYGVYLLRCEVNNVEIGSSPLVLLP